MNGIQTTPLFWLAAGFGLLLLLGAAYRRQLRWRPAFLVRAAVLVLVLLVAARPEPRQAVEPPPDREVLIIDQSESVSPKAADQARTQAMQWLAGGANRLVIQVGSEAVPASSGDLPKIDGSATDLAAALDLAAGFLADAPGRVVIATDGRPDDPLRVRAALDHLQSGPNARTVEMIALPRNASAADVFVEPLYLPASLWENTAFTAVLPVIVTLPGDIELTVSVNEVLYLDETINLPAGRSLVPIPLQTAGSEILTIAAEVRALGDPRPENNRAYAAVRVYEAPRVLLVTRNANTAGSFARALAASGLDADLVVPQDLPDRLEAVGVYEIILVDDILAADFSASQLRMLKNFVEQLGRGLVFTGGRNAFTLGGYRDTIIEPILPVKLEPPPREQNTPLTLVLVLDRSASMDGARGTPNQLRPISLAREAALRSVETLGPEDFLGILSYNASPLWSVPIRQVGMGDLLQESKNALAALSPSGGTAIYDALATAVSGLMDSSTSETRHIVLLSDGNDETALDDYLELAAFAAAEDITISTIALGVEADQELMALLAQAGGGRYYPVLDAADLPKILIDESQAAREENIREGAVRVVAGEANHPALSGLSTDAMPPLLGYNALQSRATEGAEDILRSADFEDPILSVWQYGLGRVAAWTGDLGQEWAPAWQDWEDWGRFWSNTLRYTLPDPALGPGQVEVTANPATVQIMARVLSGGGVPRSGVPVEFAMVDTHGQVRTYPVPQAAPGIYTLEIPRPPEGAYRGVVRYTDDDGFPTEVAAPVIVNYPAELRPALDPAFPAYGPLIPWSDLLPGSVTPDEIPPTQNQELQRLLVALVLLWPVDIALRRRWMPWR